MASQTVKNALLSFFQVCTPSKQVLLFHAVQNITPVKGVPSPNTLRHISIGCKTMPRVSRRNPVRDGTHDGNEEPPKSTSRTAKKMTLPTTKCTTTKGAASAKTRPVSTKSVNSKGNKIAGIPNKRGKQIVSSSTTRNSPRGRSPSHGLGIKDQSIAESLHITRKAPPKTSATCKEQGGTGNAIVVGSPWLQQHLLCCISCNMMVGMMTNMHLITQTLWMTCAHLWKAKENKALQYYVSFNYERVVRVPA